MIETLLEMLFWPITEIQKLAYSTSRLTDGEEKIPGFNLGIGITFALLIAGIVIGLLINSPIPLAVIWISLYFVGAALEGVMTLGSEGIIFPLCWWTRLFLDGLCLGFTLRYLVLPG